MSIIELKKNYNEHINSLARKLAQEFIDDKMITPKILDFIYELYQSAKLNYLDEDNRFSSAYHNPITSDLEFLLSRILYHISDQLNLGWHILLRKQKDKCAPDIRVEYNGKSIFIIEIKAKIGWMQDIFSTERFQHDLKRFEENKIKIDPLERRTNIVSQFTKYKEVFEVDKEMVFVLVVTLANAHRLKYKDKTVKDYKKTFSEFTNLNESNLVVLTNCLTQDISVDKPESIRDASQDFENMLKIILKR